VTSDAQAVPASAPRPRVRPLAVWLALFLALMVAYEFVRDLVQPATPGSALAHAGDVVSFERALGVFVEPDVQRWVHDVPAGQFATKWFYTLAYTAGFVCFFIWAWMRHRDRFPFLFRWFWVTNGIAVLGYWLFPLAPPRLAGLGLQDSTAEALRLGGSLDWFEPFRNEVAAMPSMHVGQSLLFCASIIMLGRSPWRWLALLWPAMMLTTVMATANHYLVDGIAGGLVVAAALGVTRVAWPRLARPWDAHAPRPVPAPAAA
jgi:PAP2 superfamily protein